MAFSSTAHLAPVPYTQSGLRSAANRITSLFRAFTRFAFPRLVLVSLLFSHLEKPLDAQDQQADSTKALNLEGRIERIRETPNWQFVDKHFIERIAARQPSLQGTAITVIGIASNERKEPIDGALVLLRLRSNLSTIRVVAGQADDVFAVTWTDRKGVFKFQQQPTPWVEPTVPVDWDLTVLAPGYAIGIRSYSYLDHQNHIERIELQPEEFVDGTVKDSNGQPFRDCEFGIAEIVNPYDRADIEQSLLFSELQFYVRPDAQGRFRMGGLPAQRIVSLECRNSTNQASVVRVATSMELDPFKMIAKDAPRSELVYPYFDSTFEFVAGDVPKPALRPERAEHIAKESHPTRNVAVQLLDSETGKGVSNVAVGWQNDSQEPRINPGTQVTDKDGKATLTVPQKQVYVFYYGRRFGYLTPYRRMTTAESEYNPKVERSYWMRGVNSFQDDANVSFEIQPVPPLKITVQKADGTPVAAKILVSQTGQSPGFRLPPFQTDKLGQVSIELRPVWFDVTLTVTTDDGLQGEQQIELSKDLTKSQATTIVVE